MEAFPWFSKTCHQLTYLKINTGLLGCGIVFYAKSMGLLLFEVDFLTCRALGSSRPLSYEANPFSQLAVSVKAVQERKI